jgi:hypothetical protein
LRTVDATDKLNGRGAAIKDAAATALRLLTFRVTREELQRFNRRHLALGLFCTWLVGMGRYWDDPRANFLQHLGLGSVVYVFALALLLWLVVLPLRPARWSYLHVCTFVSLVSPPAILYAIPVERFLTLRTAASVNVWFLAAVAAWRVALLIFYLRRHAALGWFAVGTTALLPLTFIVVSLTALNLERAAFYLMGGLRDATANDRAYAVLVLLSLLSFLLIIPLLVSYVALIVMARARGDKRIGLISP